MDSTVRRAAASFILLSLITGLASANSSVLGSCPASALKADVVAIDHPMVFNRLGAQNVNWMMYALRHDVIDVKTSRVLGYTPNGEKLFQEAASKHASRDIALRPDLRPRPLVLRVAEGDYLKVRFTNLLHVKSVPAPTGDDPFPNQANPFNSYPNPLPGIDHPVEHAAKDANGTAPDRTIYRIDDQVASRTVGFHPQGLELVRGIDDDSSYVGKNKRSISPSPGEEEHGSLAKPGETREYCFYAPKEGAYLISSDGAVFGGDGTSGNGGVGLFGAVTVQPKKARFYRAQVTEEEMRLATARTPMGQPIMTPTGQPVIDYEAVYPADCPTGIWCREGKAGLPILNMVHLDAEHIKRIVHGDINAIIIGPNEDGSFDCSTYPLEWKNKSACDEQIQKKQEPDSKIWRNPALPNRLEPFREFVSVFHDENAATQAFPYFFEHPELGHTLHGVRDAFMINYGSGGIGSEIIANRLKAGPMQDCLDCAFEEFFLSSFAVGDPAMLVDKPTNLVLGHCQPEFVQLIPDPSDPKKEIFDPQYASQREEYCTQPKYKLDDDDDGRATKVYYPHDPANVHHSYIGDFVKFRNLHSGKEQHIFHLHNHQWLFNANDDNSNYIDAQALGPGSGYTYEIAYGGSGNRNKTVGDAIFHCHFYPHFAQGMWYMWRNHDVFEAGTRLEVSDKGTEGIHQGTFGLMDGTPANGARALPDGEIVRGVPIPAIVPLPGKGMALMPAGVSVRPRISEHDKKVYGSVAVVSQPTDGARKNPGYPFWIAGVSGGEGEAVSVGSRPTTPPLDMFDPKRTVVGPSLSNMNMTPLPDNVSGHDGGLPRHALAGYSAHGKTHEKLTRLSAEKHLDKAKPIYYPEEGTPLEHTAMAFHAQREHETYKTSMTNVMSSAKFVTNGAPPVPGAPYNEPCIDDYKDEHHNNANLLTTGGDGKFFGGRYGSYIRAKDALPHGIEFGGDIPRVYKGANLQLDVVFNKLGYHYPQQRILTLWEDVGPLLSKERAPEPLVIRMNTFDCAMYAHTNLVPKDFYADDFQITTPTDVIGQHIHLPKWDLTSADGSANGWNYEDGTFSPGMVRERIAAINKWNTDEETGAATLEPVAHPYFGIEFLEKEAWKAHQKDAAFCTGRWREVQGDAKEFDKRWGMPGACNWFGARTTLQRWFSDPVVNVGGVHRGLGVTFTHDHLGPSTHQQLGLYATMLTEPPGSLWRHNETGETLYDASVRQDGGPTSWQAVITGKDALPLDIDNDKRDDSHREFFLQFGDFQHAYQKGAFYGVTEEGVPGPHPGGESARPDENSFRLAINPSVRKPAKPVFPDIFEFEPVCPGGPGSKKLPGAIYDTPDNRAKTPYRPCPEAISADDIGMLVVNYRNEPVGARVFDPDKSGPDGRRGMQADGFEGDMAYALQTELPSSAMRKCRPMNFADGNAPAPATHSSNPICSTDPNKPNTPYQARIGALPGDPFTPIMRAYSGDMVRIKIQAGSHEHEHNASINALAWMQGGSGFGQAPHSGWRNAQNTGLSEQFTFAARITDYESKEKYLSDRMYTLDSSQDGMWNGVWGILRSLNRREQPRPPEPVDAPGPDQLIPLPSSPKPTLLALGQGEGIDNGCPDGAGTPRKYFVSAVLANRVLDNSLDATIPFVAGSHLDQNGGTLVYNPRQTNIRIEVWDEEKGAYSVKDYGAGPLHDPTAILFVMDSDLNRYTGKLKPQRPIEPLVLRAAAGECVQIYLTNRFPYDKTDPVYAPKPHHVKGLMPDLDGYTSLSGIIPRDSGSLSAADTAGSGATSFNNNLIRPSSYIGLHPQMVHYDVHAGDGNIVGVNTRSAIAPGETKVYTWYAGTVEIVQTKIGEIPDGAGSESDVEKGTVCHPYEPSSRAALFNQYFLLEMFTRPKPRPLSHLLTENVFRRELRPIIRANYASREELESESREAEKKRENVKKEKKIDELIDEVVEAAKEFRCLDSIPADASPTASGFSDSEETFSKVYVPDASPAARKQIDFEWLNSHGRTTDNVEIVKKLLELQPHDQEAREFKNNKFSDKLLKAVRSLDGGAYFDRGKVLLKREICSALMEKSLVNTLIDSVHERHADKREQLKRLYRAAPEISRIFAFDNKGAGRLGIKNWKDSVRLAALSKDAGDGCRYVPVEFGATNLTPPDRIKQGQKGAVGALIIEPYGASWPPEHDLELVLDRQNPGDAKDNTRFTRTTATVRYPVHFGFYKRSFRDLVLVHQKGLNLRYGQYPDDGAKGAVQNLAAEKEGGNEDPTRTAPEDAHDSGHMAINYGTEPMWFRFGLPPDAPFGKEGFGGAASAWQAFSNQCCDNRQIVDGTPVGTVISAEENVGEPYVPIMKVQAGQEMRIRTLMPTGVGRAIVVELHGHQWLRDPYLAERSYRGFPIGSRPEDWGTPSQCIGQNALGMSLGGQESVTPMAHFDMVFPEAGGKHRVAGDYLWRDHGGFGITSGLWAIIRVEQPKLHWLHWLFPRNELRDNCNTVL